MIILLLISAGHALDYSSLLIIHSNKTSPELLNLFQDFPNQLEILSKPSPNLILQISLIIDITEDVFYLTFLDMLSEQLQTNYLTITKVPENSSSKRRFSLLLNHNQEAKIIENTIKALNWTQFAILSSSSQESIQLMNSIKLKFPEMTSTYTISETSDKERYTKIAKRLIKAAGLKNLIIIGYGNFLLNFQQVLKDLKLDQKSINFFFPTLTAGQVFLENSIILTQEFLTNSSSFYSMIYEIILKFLEKKRESNVDLFEDCQNHFCSEIQIVKVKNSLKEIVGFFNGSVVFYYPQAMSQGIISLKSQISLFIANGSNELNSSVSNPTYSEWYQGALYGIQQANLNNELENFEFITKSTNCGNVAFEPFWYFSCLSAVFYNPPVAYLTSNAAFGAFGNLITLKQMRLFIPQVAGYGILQGLENQTTYPEYLTLSLSIIDFALSGPSLIAKNFKWNDLIILATDDYLSIVNPIIEVLLLFGLNIINPPNLRILPANYSREDYPKYEQYFKFAKKSRCRFFIIYCNDPGLILEALYDAGLRKGDFFTFWDPYYIEKMGSETNQIYLKKRLELIQGNMIMGYKEWEGQLGIKLKHELEAKFQDINFMCLTYDAFLLIKTTIQELVSIGEDFEDPYLLIKAMRRQRMVGCIGGIFFSPGFNTRTSGKILFRQVILNNDKNNTEVIDFLILDRYSTNTVIYLNPGNWVGGSTPSNYIELNNCGFDQRVIQISEKAKTMKMIFSVILILITVIFSLISWKVFNYQIAEFVTGELINLDDIYFFSFFIFEFFQFITLEPENGIISRSVTKINFLVGFDVLSYFGFEKYKYWNFYLILLVTCFLSSFIALLDYARVLINLEKRLFFQKIVKILKVFSHFSGQVGFFPIVYLVLSIYDCEKGVGESLTSSYLEKDCKTFCYKEKHLSFLVSGTVCLYLFSSVFAFLRPYWELKQDSHVKTKPLYLLILTNVQVSTIVIKKLVKKPNSSTSGFLISGILAVFLVLTCVLQPYNYKRANVVQIMSLFLSFWCIFISSFYVLFGNFWYFYFLLGFGCFAGIFAGIFAASKCPKGFRKEIGIPINNFIKFQFFSTYDIFKKDSLYYDQVNDSSQSIKS